MDLPLHLLLLLVGLTCAASGQFRTSKRRPSFPKSQFPFPRPKLRVAPTTTTTPVPHTFPPVRVEPAVEVQRAEIHSQEHLPIQELQQGPFQTNVQFQGFGSGPEFAEPPRPSFRFTGTSTPRPKEHATPIPILRLEKQQSLDGSYKSNYETGNSIQAEETGFLKNAGKGEDQEALVQFGSYSYTDPDGQLVQVSYTADEGGFRATGSHLPTPPPVPPEVQRGLDIIFESIRREAESEAKKKKLKRLVVEPENYPIVDVQEEARTARPQLRRQEIH